jgi:hypothetical protein
VAYLLKARTVEPEKQHSFLGNGSETNNGTTSVARERIINKKEPTATTREQLDKHVPAEKVSVRE